MSTRKPRGFIDFSLTPSWASAREFWEYLWIVYRIAEPPKRRSKAGDAFIALMKATQKEASWWTFTGDAIAIDREEVYRIVAQHIGRPKSNYLSEDKPPHKHLRRFAEGNVFPRVLTSFERSVFELNENARWQPPNRPRPYPYAVRPTTLEALFNTDERNRDALRDAFGSEQVRFAFREFPLIGWTNDEVWFGTTAFAHLWRHPPGVRARALAYPFRPLPEFLQLPWSPVGPEWKPPFQESTDWMTRDFVFDRAHFTRGLFEAIAEWVPLQIPGVFGARINAIVDGAPDLVFVAETDEDVRAALLAAEAERDERIATWALLVTPMPVNSAAECTHVVQASSKHPIIWSYMTDDDLVKLSRHFGWLYQRLPMLISDVSLPDQLLMVWFLEAWSAIWPLGLRREDLASCWNALGLRGDFHVTLQALRDRRMVRASTKGGTELEVFWFGDRYPTDSNCMKLKDAAHDWLLEHPTLELIRLGAGFSHRNYDDDVDGRWHEALWSLVENGLADDEMRRAARPFRSVHALNVLLDRFPNDYKARALKAELEVLHFDTGAALITLSELLSRAGPEACGAVVEKILALFPRVVVSERVPRLIAFYFSAIVRDAALAISPDLSVRDLDAHPDERVKALLDRTIGPRPSHWRQTSRSGGGG